MHSTLPRGCGSQLTRPVNVHYRLRIEVVATYWLDAGLDQVGKKPGQTKEQCRVQRKTMPKCDYRGRLEYLQRPSNILEDGTKKRG